MINVFCNSHCFSQLAAFFIGARAERSTTENCHLVSLSGALGSIKHVMVHKNFGCGRVNDHNRRGIPHAVRSRDRPRGYLLAQNDRRASRQSKRLKQALRSRSRVPLDPFECNGFITIGCRLRKSLLRDCARIPGTFYLAGLFPYRAPGFLRAGKLLPEAL